MRGRAAATRRGACVAALEGGGYVAALPGMRAVDGREGAVPDREAHAVELREDLGQRVRDPRVDDDLTDVRLLVEAVVAVAEYAELRQPDGAAAVPFAGRLDRVLLGDREPRDAGLVRRGVGRRGRDRDDGGEGEGRDALHPPAMVPAIGPGRSQGADRPPSERATPQVRPSRSPPRLEPADAVRRAEARRAVVAGLGGAEVAAHRVRREIRPLRDVVEARLVAVGIGAV